MDYKETLKKVKLYSKIVLKKKKKSKKQRLSGSGFSREETQPVEHL